MKEKIRNQVPVKWVFKNKEDTNGLIRLKSKKIVTGYMQVPGVNLKELLSPVASYKSTRILIGLNLYHKEEGWVADLCDVEAELLHPDMQVEMFI